MTERWEREGGVLWRRMGGSVVLMTYPRKEVIVLAQTGSALWDRLDVPATLQEVAACLGRAYDVPVERVAEEIAPVLLDLESRAVLRRRVA